jgi:hypothetical protein
VKDGRCTTPAIKACIKYRRDWYGREPADQFGPLALKTVRQRMIDDGLSRRYIHDHVARGSSRTLGRASGSSSRLGDKSAGPSS